MAVDKLATYKLEVDKMVVKILLDKNSAVKM